MEHESWPASFQTRFTDYGADDDILLPFALDEVLCRQMGEGRVPLIHIWRHPKAFVVGLRDRKLPNAELAMKRLREQGYAVGVRNSGGAAVPLDAGVVNISIVLPNKPGRLNFHKEYGMMAELIRRSLAPWTAQVREGEIAGSYCPGESDLSIGGRKFCGIAQRRQVSGFAVQAFVVVEGGGRERAEWVKEFYDTASVGSHPTAYPSVESSVMASLQELTTLDSSMDFIKSLLYTLEQTGGRIPDLEGPGLPLTEIGETAFQLKNRYDK